MAGASRSGDLIRPQHSIPLGTLCAQLATSILCTSMIFQSIIIT
jgi:hypothetical protein